MRTKRFDGMEIAGELGFGQCCMNFVVADLMQQHRRAAFAAAKLRDQMVQALAGVLWDRALAKRANGVIAHG